MAGTMNKGSLIKGTGGSGGGGSASFPTIVTDSGSSLPVDLTGYQLNDTFLNTSDRKIYKTEETIIGYTLATGVTNTATFDSTTGVVSGFQQAKWSPITVPAKKITKSSSSIRWTGNLTFQIVFKMDTINNSSRGCLVDFLDGYGGSTSYPQKAVDIYVGTDNKIYYMERNNSSGTSWFETKNVILLDFTINNTTKYKLSLQKTGSSLFAELKNAETDEILSSNTIEVENSMIVSYTTQSEITYGLYGIAELKGQIYLGDSTGDFVTPTTSLSWDSGTDITDKTEYADKTNGALYLYENTELVKIGGNLTKKVYTISADNTSTLDVSSDFTKIVDVLKNGVEIALTDDYTISSGVITFVTALSTTDKITVKGE